MVESITRFCTIFGAGVPPRKPLEEAMQLPEAEREDLAAALLDSLEPRPGISIDDRDELERRAADARGGVPGVPWEEVQRGLKK
ncbi:MAG: addiction module protein [Polyangiaceae bacterium]|nr:addiction module protein [Polyangiaceae bacterium]